MGKESAERIQTSLLSKAEKKALVWLAQRQPGWMTSDTLTYIGVLGTVIYAIGGWLSNTDIKYLWLSSFGLVLHWYGDSLDGTLARFRNTQRPVYGFFIDHTLDAVTTCLIFLGAGLSPMFRMDVALAALALPIFHLHLRMYYRQGRILPDVRQTRSYRIPFAAYPFKHTLHVHVMVRMACRLAGHRMGNIRHLGHPHYYYPFLYLLGTVHERPCRICQTRPTQALQQTKIRRTTKNNIHTFLKWQVSAHAKTCHSPSLMPDV